MIIITPVALSSIYSYCIGNVTELSVEREENALKRVQTYRLLMETSLNRYNNNNNKKKSNPTTSSK